jgi:RNA polymerase sigma factor (TIGR02999 family)
MDLRSTHEVTQLLQAWSNGDESALRELIPLVYDDLLRIAKRYMKQEREGHTLQTTALANEAYLRLVRVKNAEWESRAHFFALYAQLMRRILVDHARARAYTKRGGGACRVELDEALALVGERSATLVALDNALNELSLFDPRKSKVVEMRFFGGMEIQQVAEVLRVSPDTVKRDWRLAKLWLARELGREEGNGA